MPLKGDISQEGDAKKILTLFNELQIYWNELAKGNEHECLALVDLVDRMRLKWLDATNENEGLRIKVQDYEREMEAKTEQIRSLKVNLTEARAHIGSLQARYKEVETERNELERQVDIVAELLRSTDAMSNPIASSTMRRNLKPPGRLHMGRDLTIGSVDYDETENTIFVEAEDGDVSVLRNGSTWRRSKEVTKRKDQSSRGKNTGTKTTSQQPDMTTLAKDNFHPMKRSKDDHYIGGESGPGEPKDLAAYPGNGHLMERRSLNRSFSQPHLGPNTAYFGPPPPYNNHVPLAKSTMDLRSPKQASSWETPGKLSQRQHLFVSKTILKPDYCDACGKKLTFGRAVMKCQDCKFTCHAKCKGSARKPCIPRPNGSPFGGRKTNRLVELVPSVRPHVPHILVHCVLELEKRGDINQEGVYRTQGTKEEVNLLFHKFTTMRGAPDLSGMSGDAIVGVIKKFLGSLRDPLIPLSSRKDFRILPGASVFECHSLLMRAVIELPLPNRDTLAYFMVHLQRVAAASCFNKMTAPELAKSLAPTVVGFTGGPIGPDLYRETEEIKTIMNGLLTLPHSFWENLLCCPNAPPAFSPKHPPTSRPTMLAVSVPDLRKQFDCMKMSEHPKFPPEGVAKPSAPPLTPRTAAVLGPQTNEFTQIRSNLYPKLPLEANFVLPEIISVHKGL